MSSYRSHNRRNLNLKSNKKKDIICNSDGPPNYVPFELWPMIIGVYDYTFLQRFRLISKFHKQLVESYRPQHIQLYLNQKTVDALTRIKNSSRRVFSDLRTIGIMSTQDNNGSALLEIIYERFKHCEKLVKIYTTVSLGIPAAPVVHIGTRDDFDVEEFLRCPLSLKLWLNKDRKRIDCWNDVLYVLEKYAQRGTYVGSPEELSCYLNKLLQLWKCPMDIIELFIEFGIDLNINTLLELYRAQKLPLIKFQRLIQKYNKSIIVDNTKLTLFDLISNKDDGNNLYHWLCKYSSSYIEEIMEGLGRDINSKDLNRVNTHEVAPVFYLFTQQSPSSNAFLKLKPVLNQDLEITRKAILTDPQFENTYLRKFCQLHNKKSKLSLIQIIISMTNWTKIVEQYVQNDPSLLKQKNLIFWTCSRHKSLWLPAWSTNPQFLTLIDLHDVVFGRRDIASVINPQPVFMQAGKYGLYPIVKDFVIRRTGDINLKRRDQKGDTIMHLLAKTQPVNIELHLPLKQILRFLLTKGAPDVKNNEGLSFRDILQNRTNTTPIL